MKNADRIFFQDPKKMFLVLRKEVCYTLFNFIQTAGESGTQKGGKEDEDRIGEMESR